jgi:ABC-2 type transport system ATP-binding protein
MIPLFYENAVVVHELVKAYGPLHALDGLSFSVARGEFFGILGPNGAGKTTTMGILAGLISPDAGSVMLAGEQAIGNNADLKKRLGLVPQELAFYPTLSAVDNLSFFGSIYGLRGGALQEHIRDVLQIVQLEDRSKEPVSHFSNGMKRRLNLAIGLLHKPEILLLDEPTVGVDAQSRNAILESLQRLNREGVTILYSTHYMEEAQRLCGDLAIFDHGRIIARGSPRDLVQSLGEGLLRVKFLAPVSEDFLDQLRSSALTPWTSNEDMVVQIKLDSKNKESAIRQVFAGADTWKLTIRNLQVLEPSLESVFLNLTGRELRD